MKKNSKTYNISYTSIKVNDAVKRRQTVIRILVACHCKRANLKYMRNVLN